MIDIQEKWLTRLVDAKAGQDKQDAREAQKQAVIGKLAADRERQRLTISDGVDQEVVNAKGKKQRTHAGLREARPDQGIRP